MKIQILGFALTVIPLQLLTFADYYDFSVFSCILGQLSADECPYTV